MKVLHLTNMLNQTDGVTSYLYYLSKGLQEAGVHVQIFCGGGNAVEKFTRDGLKVISSEAFAHDKRSMGNFVSSVKKIAGMIRRTGMDLLHSHNHYAANIAHYASKLTGIVTIQTIHGLIPETGRLKHFRADKYVSVNENAIKCLLSNGINRSIITLIRAGIPFKKNPVRRAHSGIRIVCASRLENEKGIDVFINAVSKIHKDVLAKADFFIAGTGSLEKELKRLSHNQKLNIKFSGEVKDMLNLFADTDITVYPTRCSTEGFPMTIVEAASMKNLIISSRFDSLKEIFTNGTDGFVFGINNDAELASILTDSIKNIAGYKYMADNFHEKAGKLFNIHTCVEKHLQLYNGCLKQ